MDKFSWSCGATACLFFALIGETQAQTAPTSDWTGFYVGAHIGNAVSGSDWKDASGAPLPVPYAGHFTGGGIVRGVQAGYNYQRGNFVLGLEAEGGFADIDGGVQCAAAVFSCDAKIEALGTVTGRLGYATGDFLVYGKAGGGWLHEKLTMAPNPGTSWSDTWQGRQTRLGLALGGGVEYAFSPLASAKIEYSYLGFGDRVDLTDPNGNRLSVGLDQNIHLVKLGLNYKLAGAPFTRAYHSSPGAPPSRIWDGVYAGVHTGGAFGTTDWKSAAGPLATIADLGFPGSGTADGMIAGGQIGFNRQMGSLVVGGEIDASWANLDGFAKCATSVVPPPTFSLNFNCHSHINAMGTFAGRLGWAHDNVLIYGKAGAAWANESDTATRADLPNAFKGSSLRWGYVLGSGLEYAFTPAWSGKVEYNYLDFGTKTVELSDQFGNASSVGIGQRTHLFKMGLNYRFGVDPALASSAHSPLVFKAPQRASDWLVEIGARYWYSNGGLQKDLYDPDRTTQLNSRLIYSDMNGHSAETFARLDHRSGLFVKGNFGLGSLVNGKLNDEDFSPINIPYSNTEHQVRDSSLRYGSLDVGTTLLSGNDGKLGAYVGYRYFYQRGRGFGCVQVGADDGCVVPAPPDALGLTETEQWRGAALGLNARFGLSDRWRLEVDAAYLPYVDHATVDNHWNRPNINPAPAPGRGWGSQIEAILSYAVTDRFSLGIGGRYWFFATDEAATRFPNVSTLSPLKYTSERYGGFLQASYKFGGPDQTRVAAAEEAPPAHWTGWYVGGHLGAGFGGSDWSDPFPPPPTGDRVHVGGALGGAQIGVNYQTGKMVVGAELSGSLSQLEGTQTCFGGFQPPFFAGQNCENTTRNFGMLTARLGYATGRNLFYGKAGGVLARETYTLNSNGIPGGTVSSTSATNLGWTVGAGVEHALSSRWSVNAEYKYLDFGKRSVDFTVPGMISAASTETIQTREHLLTLGVNYRFSE